MVVRRGAAHLGAWIIGALVCCQGSHAQEWWDETRHGVPVPSIATSLPYGGDPYGTRKWLAERGIVFGLEYTGDLLSNVRGGLRTGTVYQGKLQGIVIADFDRLAGWRGLTGFANAFQIHNTGRIRRDYVGGINTIAAIEAVPTTRLSEVWLQQTFAGELFSVRAGQLAADSEFYYSELSTMFLHSDWPTIAALNLPGSGAAYPLSTPGIRLKMSPAKSFSFMVAALNGDPAGAGAGDPELANRHGLNFRINDPPFFIAETQLQRNAGARDAGLATTLKLGGWWHTGQFDDRTTASDGRSLADPGGSGVPRRHRGNYGAYAIVDQQLYRPPGGDVLSGVSVFSRLSFAPSDRNPVDVEIDGGIVVAGLWSKRPDDRFGASILHARFTDGAPPGNPIATAANGYAAYRPETNLELTYMAQVVPGWTVQPALTFVWNPAQSSRRDATVVGVRSLVRY